MITFEDPADPFGEVQVIEVDETIVTEVHGFPPTVTTAPLANAVPVIVITVPPAVGPDDGLSEVMVGEEIGVTKFPEWSTAKKLQLGSPGCPLYPKVLSYVYGQSCQ